MFNLIASSLASRLIVPTLRHVAQMGFGALASYGVLNESQVESGIGIIMSVVMWLWMLVDKKRGK